MGKAIRIIVLGVIIVALVVAVVLVVKSRSTPEGPTDATLRSAEPTATEGGE
ncbi:MAG: hypothetical protein JXO22_03040 [Phycisphaerae bacterium]|nr:hypothetical protein [Phycisphaerae bacterium]